MYVQSNLEARSRTTVAVQEHIVCVLSSNARFAVFISTSAACPALPLFDIGS